MNVASFKDAFEAHKSEQERKMEEKKKVLDLLQTLLLAVKGGIPLERLNREFHDMMGMDIPYGKFGYNDLQELLYDAQDYCKVVIDHVGVVVVRALVPADCAHLSEMIKKQITKRKKKSVVAVSSSKMQMSNFLTSFRRGTWAQDEKREKEKNKLVPMTTEEIRQTLNNCLSFENYCERFSILLACEMDQMEVDIRQFDMTAQTLQRFFKPDHYKLKVPGLAEKRPSVMRKDKIIARLSDDPSRKFDGTVQNVGTGDIVVEFPKEMSDCVTMDTKFNIQFTINLCPFERMSDALKIVEDDPDTWSKMLFPTPNDIGKPVTNMTKHFLKFYNPMVGTNAEQWTTVVRILQNRVQGVPYLIFGPPGTGKTMTLVEAIKQTWKLSTKSNILVAASSNSAADLLAQRLIEHIPQTQVLRYYAGSVDISRVPANLVNVSSFKAKGIFSPKGLKRFKIIVVTFLTSGKISSFRFPDSHFTHIFMDEVGNSVEPEALTALTGLVGSKGCQVVMAGDPMQLGPIIQSRLASRKGLGTSMLERLMNLEIYKPDVSTGKYNNNIIMKLVQNFRSHSSILRIPSELFYKSGLLPKAAPFKTDSYLNWNELPNKRFPIIFEGVVGQEGREHTCPSFHNLAEAKHVVDYIAKLTSLTQIGIERASFKDIAVLSPYRGQIKKIREMVSSRFGAKPEMTVGSTEELQGQERKIIIVSTVRSKADTTGSDALRDLGFLTNPKRFNVALTRAQALLIVVGNATLLSIDENWKIFIHFVIKNEGYRGVSMTGFSIDRSLSAAWTAFQEPVEPKKLITTVTYNKNGEQLHRTTTVEQSPENNCKNASDIKENYKVAPTTRDNNTEFSAKSYRGEVPLKEVYESLCDLSKSSANGVWSSRLEVEYFRMSQKNLPANWSEYLESFQAESGQTRLHFDRSYAGRCLISHLKYSAAEEQGCNSPQLLSQAVLAGKAPHVDTEPSQEHLQPLAQPDHERLSNLEGSFSSQLTIKTGTCLDQAKSSRCLGQADPPELIMPPGQFWEVFVTQVISTSEISVRFFGENYSVALDQLMDQMDDYYQDVGKDGRVNQFKIGQICVVTREEELHRVKILDQTSDLVLCYSIDAGGEADWLKKKEVKEIHPDFMKLAPQAVTVNLEGLINLEDSRILSILSEMILHQSLVAEVCPNKENKISVSLIDINTGEDVYINQKILDIVDEGIEILSNSSEISEAELSSGSTSSGLGASPVPSADVETSPTSSSDSAGLVNPALDFLSQIWRPLDEPCISKNGSDVYVTRIKSPSDFTIKFFSQSPSSLINLMTSMNAFYSNPQNFASFVPTSLDRDPYCTALCVPDTWCRVEILARLEGPYFLALLVDEGTKAKVSAESLQPLWPQFRMLPKMAAKACLAGLKARDQDWSFAERNWFVDNTLNEPFVAYFCDADNSRDNVAKVDNVRRRCKRIAISLMDTSGNEDINIAEEMIKTLGCRIKT